MPYYNILAITSRDPNSNVGDQVRWDSDGGVQGERGAEQAAGGGLCHRHLDPYLHIDCHHHRYHNQYHELEEVFLVVICISITFKSIAIN